MKVITFLFNLLRACILLPALVLISILVFIVAFAHTANVKMSTAIVLGVVNALNEMIKRMLVIKALTKLKTVLDEKEKREKDGNLDA